MTRLGLEVGLNKCVYPEQCKAERLLFSTRSLESEKQTICCLRSQKVKKVQPFLRSRTKAQQAENRVIFSTWMAEGHVGEVRSGALSLLLPLSRSCTFILSSVSLFPRTSRSVLLHFLVSRSDNSNRQERLSVINMIRFHHLPSPHPTSPNPFLPLASLIC